MAYINDAIAPTILIEEHTESTDDYHAEEKVIAASPSIAIIIGTDIAVAATSLAVRYVTKFYLVPREYEPYGRYASALYGMVIGAVSGYYTASSAFTVSPISDDHINPFYEKIPALLSSALGCLIGYTFGYDHRDLLDWILSSSDHPHVIDLGTP